MTAQSKFIFWFIIFTLVALCIYIYLGMVSTRQVVIIEPVPDIVAEEIDLATQQQIALEQASPMSEDERLEMLNRMNDMATMTEAEYQAMQDRLSNLE